MIAFDLRCAAGAHVFEAWFASSDSFAEQQQRGLLICPLCADTNITKAVMAPNIPAKSNQRATPAVDSPGGRDAMLAALAQAQAKALKSSTWVGQDFDRQARAIDAGEAPPAQIHGQTTPEQARALLDDGIAVLPLLVPVVPPEQQN